MTAIAELGPERKIRERGGNIFLDIRSSGMLTFYPASLVAIRRGSSLAEVPDPLNPRNDLIFIGACVNYIPSTTVADSSAAADANGFHLKAICRPGILEDFDTGTGANAITADMIGNLAYGYDSNTLYATDLDGVLSPVGFIHSVNADGTVNVTVEPDLVNLAWLLGAGRPAAQQAMLRGARNVVFGNIASLAAYTVAASTTVNDNVLNVEGDRVLLVAQTTVAQNALYEVGVVTTGVAPLTRVPDMPAGATMPNGCKVAVSEGGFYAGKTWRATATTAGGWVVGTNDPAFYPEEYTQTVTLSSGAYLIGNGSTATPDEPLFLLAGANIQCTVNAHAGTLGTNKIEANTRTTGIIGTAKFTVTSLLDNGSASGETSTVDVLVRQ